MTTSFAPAPGPGRRQRTPSDLKWLLAERAALAGELCHLQHQVRLAVIEYELAEAWFHRLTRERQTLEARQADVAERRNALDAVLGLTHPSVNPAAGGQVRANSGRWGGRGALTAFLCETLQAAAPQALPTAVLLTCALAHSGIEPSNAEERKRLYFVLRKRLKGLRDKHGLLDSSRSGDGYHDDVLWRWKQPTSLDRLRALAEATEAAEALDDAPPHPDAL